MLDLHYNMFNNFYKQKAKLLLKKFAGASPPDHKIQVTKTKISQKQTTERRLTNTTKSPERYSWTAVAATRTAQPGDTAALEVPRAAAKNTTSTRMWSLGIISRAAIIIIIIPIITPFVHIARHIAAAVRAVTGRAVLSHWSRMPHVIIKIAM